MLLLVLSPELRSHFSWSRNWLKINERIPFKMLSLTGTYKARRTNQPIDLRNLLIIQPTSKPASHSAASPTSVRVLALFLLSLILRSRLSSALNITLHNRLCYWTDFLVLDLPVNFQCSSFRLFHIIHLNHFTLRLLLPWCIRISLLPFIVSLLGSLFACSLNHFFFRYSFNLTSSFHF